MTEEPKLPQNLEDPVETPPDTSDRGNTVDVQPKPPEQKNDFSASLQKLKQKDLPIITYGLIGFTVLIFLAQQLSKSVLGIDLPISLLAKVNAAIRNGQYWRLITQAFVHANVLHILMNMYAVHILGRNLEKFYGWWRYLVLYFLGALGGGVFSFVLSSSNSVGASTAVFALLAGEVVFIWQNRKFFGSQSRAILMNLGMVLVLNLSLGIAFSGSIDNWGHLGGLVAGLFFSFMAGPKLSFARAEKGVKMVDSRSKMDVLFAAIMVLAALLAIALIPFFAY